MMGKKTSTSGWVGGVLIPLGTYGGKEEETEGGCERKQGGNCAHQSYHAFMHCKWRWGIGARK